ncbi:putative SnoaL-like domain-containing protein [Seiridium cardinale]
MPYEPTASELAAHTFSYDAGTLDKELADFILKFYTLSDDKVHADDWAACFSDEARMKRKMDDVVGRQNISNVNLESWKGQAARLHIVYKVFPFSAGKTDEIMLYGKSEYDYEDGTTGEMPWSARLHFKRSDSDILIDFYQVYSGQLQKPKSSS